MHLATLHPCKVSYSFSHTFTCLKSQSSNSFKFSLLCHNHLLKETSSRVLRCLFTRLHRTHRSSAPSSRRSEHNSYGRHSEAEGHLSNQNTRRELSPLLQGKSHIFLFYVCVCVCVCALWMCNKTGAESLESFLLSAAFFCIVMQQSSGEDEDLSQFVHSHSRYSGKHHVSSRMSVIIYVKQLRFYIELQHINVSWR